MHTVVEQVIAETMVEDPDKDLDLRVQRGAAKLDLLKPGWADKINLSTFQISDSARCVLGQIYETEGHFVGGMKDLYRYRGDGHPVPDGAFEDGFITHGDDYPDLQRDWKEAIKARQT